MIYELIYLTRYQKESSVPLEKYSIFCIIRDGVQPNILTDTLADAIMRVMESKGKRKDKDPALGSSSCSTRPLHLATPGEQLLIRSIRGGWDVRRRLKKLGIVPGEQMMVLSIDRDGSLEVTVAGVHHSVPVRLAHHILVH